MKSLLRSLFQSSVNSSEDTRYGLYGISYTVDHIIRLFTALGFLCGLVILNKQHPNNDLIIILMIVLGIVLIFYGFFITSHTFMWLSEKTPYIKDRLEFRKYVTGISTLIYMYLTVFHIIPAISSIAEMGLFR